MRWMHGEESNEMRFLIVSYSCAPLNIISSQRVNALAKYLVGCGHEVTILTSVKHPTDGPVDAITQWRELESLVEVHEVEFLGRKRLQYAGDKKKSGTGSHGWMGPSLRGILKKCRSIASILLGALFDYRTVWALCAVAYYRRMLASRQFDIMVTSSGPACVNYVGFRVSRISKGLRWVADFRDLWSLLHSSKVTALTRKAEMLIERRLLAGAARITTVSSHLCEQMQALHDIPVQVVRNGYDPVEFENLVADRDFFPSRGCAELINIVYAGSIYEGGRDPSPLIAAVAASDARRRIAIHFFGFNLGHVPAQIKSLGAGDFCHVHASKPREEILSIQKAADINLLLESGREDARGVLTGKLFELAAIQRPVLSVGPPLHFESMEILRRTGLHVHWETTGGDVDEVLARAREASPVPDFIRTLSRESQFMRVPEFA